jgi:hypothetical protein
MGKSARSVQRDSFLAEIVPYDVRNRLAEDKAARGGWTRPMDRIDINRNYGHIGCGQQYSHQGLDVGVREKPLFRKAF